MTTPHAVLDQLKQHTVEIRELDIGETVETISSPVTAAEFVRNYVAGNKPCLITGAVREWPAYRDWDKDFLKQKAGEHIVTVDYTPNGRGDAITPYCDSSGNKNTCFCTPLQLQLPFAEFLEEYFDVRSRKRVPYLQHQNSNLSQELPILLSDVDAELGWACEAFGGPPDAINLWIGDQRSATTYHKDHYENIYAVVRGTKIFHLLPPTDIYRMYLQTHPLAQYQEVAGELTPVLHHPPQLVSWSPIDPNPQDPCQAAAQYPLYFDPKLPKPLRVEVHAGEMLYLPAMWYHYVEQRPDPQQGWCIAVNYWFDMRFNVQYAHYKLVEGLAGMLCLVPKQLDDGDGAQEGEVLS